MKLCDGLIKIFYFFHPNRFVVSLAVGDLLMAALCVPPTVVGVVVLHHWPFGHLPCVLVSYLQVLMLANLY